MLLLITVILAIHLVGALILLVAWFHAPEGYEDSTGFHYGKEGEDTADMGAYSQPERTPDRQHPQYGMTEAFRGSR